MTTYFATPNDDLQLLLNNAEPYSTVKLSKGCYRQKLEIDVEGITIEGAADGSVITFGDYAKKLDERGVEYNTFRTYTVAVCANNVTLKNLTVRNDSGNSPLNGQEVALTVYGDNFTADNCRLLSEQDTLFCGPLPLDLIARYDGFLKNKLRRDIKSTQRYLNCTIAGTVDFIFGCGDCLFDKCKIISLNDGRHGFVAAPAHALEQNVGFVFNQCEFEGEGLDGRIYLARPWRDYGKAGFINCKYGKHIAQEGFDKWNDTERDKTARFAEYGVDRTGRVAWSRELTQNQADKLLKYFND